jgi:hypothetical protein
MRSRNERGVHTHFLSEQEDPSQKTLYAEGIRDRGKPVSTSV